MNDYKFTDYLDFLYGDKLSIHPQMLEQINELIDNGIVFDLDKDSWVVVEGNSATLLRVVDDKSPYQLVVTKTNLNRFRMPA